MSSDYEKDLRGRMIHSTWQIRNWTGDFGKDYTKRNIRTIYQRDEKYKQLLGVTRSDLNLDFMKEIDRSISILEIGSNAGDQLLLLKQPVIRIKDKKEEGRRKSSQNHFKTSVEEFFSKNENNC